jgi:hypothetical protein
MSFGQRSDGKDSRNRSSDAARRPEIYRARKSSESDELVKRFALFGLAGMLGIVILGWQIGTSGSTSLASVGGISLTEPATGTIEADVRRSCLSVADAAVDKPEELERQLGRTMSERYDTAGSYHACAMRQSPERFCDYAQRRQLATGLAGFMQLRATAEAYATDAKSRAALDEVTERVGRSLQRLVSAGYASTRELDNAGVPAELVGFAAAAKAGESPCR